MQRGIDSGQDIDPNFLGEIYDNITSNEIVMKNDPNRKGEEMKAIAALNPKRRHTVFQDETSQMIKRTEELVHQHKGEGKAGARPQATWYEATERDVDAIVPMFEIVMYPALAAFSMIYETTDDPVLIALLLQGYVAAIRVAGAFNVETARVAFINSLKKHTLLGSGKEMKAKNVNAIETLLQTAHREGNYLKASWKEILECISELEVLQNERGSRKPMDVFRSAPSQTNNNNKRNSVAFKTAEQITELNANAVAERIAQSLVDRVFTMSANLNSDAVVDFVEALRQVSLQELQSASAPRVFSLQKIIEVTCYNMGRIRLVWTKIWATLAPYFAAAGCHANLNVSMRAIDSLRQAAMKFLEKDELSAFQFQGQFLRPFEGIMKHSPSNDAKELVVQCLQRMVIINLITLHI